MKRELLDNGNIWRKSDGRWIGMVRYKDEYGVTQRKSFSAKKKKDLQAKMTAYVASFQEQIADSNESRKPLKNSMQNWLQVYKYPEVEHTTYDRYECTAENQIYPYIGDKPVGDITSADIKKLLTVHMNKGLAFTTSKKAYSILKMYFKYLYQEGIINLNPSLHFPEHQALCFRLHLVLQTIVYIFIQNELLYIIDNENNLVKRNADGSDSAVIMKLCNQYNSSSDSLAYPLGVILRWAVLIF